MPERNRVLPGGGIVAAIPRGAWMGNRGRLHEGREIVRMSRSRAWIVCRLSFRGRRVEQWSAGRYTPLFFRDEAVALAAGHRPCGECRHADYLTYRDAAGARDVGVLDARLDGERRDGPARLAWRDIPDGAFALTADGPALVLRDSIIAWDDARYGYGAARRRPRIGAVESLTPPTSLEVLRCGYAVQVDEDAVGLRDSDTAVAAQRQTVTMSARPLR